nr:LysE family translocator [Kibdelosporangium sp. MJ126-NF4]CEL18584.1 Putative threonine efflux protein [Kibdelosporangium sp. MJ126-NF4]CTQ98068.1 Putative threonine efflux protein [Kibdelosporangium sp. MJ126-NF4]
MIDPTLYLTFLVTAAILVITPGPDMIFIVAVGVRGGPMTGFMAALGVAVGLAVHTAAAVLGLSAMFAALPLLYDAMRWIGAAYLLYLAFKAFTARNGSLLTPQEGDTPAPTGHWRTFRQAVVTNLLNPKVIVFSIAFLPQFVRPDLGAVGLQFLILGVTLIVVDLAIDGAVGLLAGRIGHLLGRSRRVLRALDYFSGTVFAGLATRLALVRD